MGSRRRAGQRPGRGSILYVQPAELARKLVKEMEDHKVSRAARVSVPNRYTVFLCPEDFERVYERRAALADKLERHLAARVRAKKYDLSGDIMVDLVLDADLKFGQFGILAERGTSEGWDEEPWAEQIAPANMREARRAPAAQPGRDIGGYQSPAPAGRPRSGATEVIRPEDASYMDLARQTLVVRAGNREREFTKGRVIVGRGRDVDFRVEDPNVSRRHAVIFWAEGRVMIEDLGSTNGTMVNGYPISTTVVRPGDVIAIGDCRITVEPR